MKLRLLFLCLCAQAACASLTASSTDRLRVSASPPGATVEVDGEARGTAPMSVELPKRRRSAVEVVAPGYRSASCDTRMSASGGYVAADVALCVLLFPLGCLSFIDAGGAWNELEQPHCRISLVPDTKEAPKAAPPLSNAPTPPAGS